MLPLSLCRGNYLYEDFQEILATVAMAPKVLAMPDRGGRVRRGRELWASLLHQGAIFKRVGAVNWRVPPEPATLPMGLVRDLREIGPLVDRLVQAVDRHLGQSPFLREMLGFPACPEEAVLWELGHGEPLTFFRLDMTLAPGNSLKLFEIQVVMGGLGIAQALRSAYGPNPGLPGTATLYQQAMEARFIDWSMARGLDPFPRPVLVATLGSGTSPYRHEHLLLARHLDTLEMVVAPLRCIRADPGRGLILPDGRRPMLVHRLFRSPSLFRSAPRKAEEVLSAVSAGKLCLANPWKDYLEDKRVLALVHHPRTRKEMPGALSEGDWDRLAALVPATWLADKERIADLMGLPLSRRGYYLKKGRSFEGRQIVDGQQLSSRQWEAACLRARQEGDWIVQESIHGPPWPFEYLDFQSQEIRAMEGYVRLSPFYFRAGDGTLNLGEVLITAREDRSKVHGASDAILVVPGRAQTMRPSGEPSTPGRTRFP